MVKILGFFWCKGEKRKEKEKEKKKEKKTIEVSEGMGNEHGYLPIEFSVMKKKNIYQRALLLTCIAVEFMPSRTGI